MRPVTLVMAYYENPTMLQVQYQHIAELPEDIRNHLHVVLVDDGSPDNCAFPRVGHGIASLQIYRIGVDVRWNQDAARNIGVHHSTTDWLMLTDMDHVVPETTWRALMVGYYSPHTVHTFTRQLALLRADGKLAGVKPHGKPHPNSWFMTRAMYDRVGGYDERFAGIYGTDIDFKMRLEKIIKIVCCNLPLTLYSRDQVPDAATNRYVRKTPEDLVRRRAVWAARDADPDPRPKRLTFPYVRVA